MVHLPILQDCHEYNLKFATMISHCGLFGHVGTGRDLSLRRYVVFQLSREYDSALQQTRGKSNTDIAGINNSIGFLQFSHNHYKSSGY